jgi:copper chaperone CopZ
MKERHLATAREVMRRATGVEGMSVAEAMRHHHERGEIIGQYALHSAAGDGTPPRCLAAMPHAIDGTRFTVLPLVVDQFVETFLDTLAALTVVPAEPAGTAALAPEDRVFLVPDMTCTHCIATITRVLGQLEVAVVESSLDSKRFVADFPTLEVRERAFEAIRARGYTIVPADQP